MGLKDLKHLLEQLAKPESIGSHIENTLKLSVSGSTNIVSQINTALNVPLSCTISKEKHTFASLYKSCKKNAYAHFCLCVHTLLVMKLHKDLCM